MDSDRGTGRTRDQILKAKQNAIYIWPNRFLSYPRMLARSLDRLDIIFYSRDALKYNGEQLRGMEMSELIIDHAIKLTDEEWEVYSTLQAYVRSFPTFGGGVTAKTP